jgi:hypothetical protein
MAAEIKQQPLQIDEDRKAQSAQGGIQMARFRVPCLGPFRSEAWDSAGPAQRFYRSSSLASPAAPKILELDYVQSTRMGAGGWVTK